MIIFPSIFYFPYSIKIASAAGGNGAVMAAAYGLGVAAAAALVANNEDGFQFDFGPLDTSVEEQGMHAYIPVASNYRKQPGLAVWLECRPSHLGVAGLGPSHDNL